ncbi:hypothetical protein ATANTOWER_018920 [Ataeniobius toweri]|uniref:Inositol 1,4,5-trisphosphate/ryanodine receptor domain-containing protein n=1 Tax=Ataeniobius toweri TaxID=208326 RepID=A0ABU7AYL4_9TELE|nr:hypothetical protein [Ataeniobius toweri]
MPKSASSFMTSLLCPDPRFKPLPSDANVPPDLSICTFVLEQSLSVRALQEMLANTEEKTEGQKTSARWASPDRSLSKAVWKEVGLLERGCSYSDSGIMGSLLLPPFPQLLEVS